MTKFRDQLGTLVLENNLRPEQDSYPAPKPQTACALLAMAPPLTSWNIVTIGRRRKPKAHLHRT